MPMTSSSIVSYRLPSLPQHHIKSSSRSQALFFKPISHLAISNSTYSYGCSFPGNRSSRYLSTSLQKPHISNNTKMNFVVHSSDQQGDRSSFGAVVTSWKNWIIGAFVTVILPFLTNKWGPILKWIKVIEAVEEKVEHMAEDIEKVAEKVEEAAEEMVEKLPEGGMLRNTITAVENAAKETIKVADSVEELIDKVEEMEKKVEDAINEQESHKSNGTADSTVDPGQTVYGNEINEQASQKSNGAADSRVEPRQTVLGNEERRP